MNKRIISSVIIIVVLALAIGAVLLRKHRDTVVDELATVGEIPWALHTQSVSRGSLSNDFPVLASLSGSTEITISSQVSGVIESMGPREGVTVEKGEQLAKISVDELRQQRAGLDAQRESAIAEKKRTHDEYERQKQLKEKGLTTQELVDAKNAAAISAQKQVANIIHQISAMDVRLSYGTVFAPGRAIVAARLMEVGDIAQPGKPLYKLTVDSAARLKVSLPQQILEQVHTGTRVLLEHGSQHQEIILTRIFPALDMHAMGSAEADIDAMPFDLPSGARIPAQVILNTFDDVLIVPHRSLVKTGDQGFLFKIVNHNGQDTVKRVRVSVLLDAGSNFAVEGEINADDAVVVAHQSVLMQLRDGDPVIVSTEAANP
jgi:RND family efflux transporter MFP subunit